MAKQSLESWIREAMHDPDKDGGITAMVLVHMIGQTPRELHTVKFGTGRSHEPKGLADLFDSKARNYAQELPGVQTFNLMAFYGNRTSAEAFHPFLVNQSADMMSGIGGLATEGPTEQGRLQQSMRQVEALFQQNFRQHEVNMGISLRMMQEMRQDNERLSAENRDMFTIFKELIIEKATNDHNRKMAQLQFARDTEERKKWMAMAPPLINTLTGKEIFPQETADTALVEMVADALEPEQAMQLAGMLKPEVVGVLMNRLQKAQEKKNREAEEAAKLAVINARTNDPESDAAGDVDGTTALLGAGNARH